MGELGAGAHAFSDLQGVIEERAEDRTAEPGRARFVEGRADLLEDLVLAQDERVERGDDAEEVPRGAATGVEEELSGERVLRAETQGSRQGDAIVASGRVPVLARPEELQPVAGREQRGLRGAELVRQGLDRRLREAREPALDSLESLDVGLVERE